MRVLLVLSVIGQILRYFGIAVLPAAILALVDGDWKQLLGFVTTGLISWGLGEIATRSYQRPRIFFRAEALAVVAGTWLAVAAVSGIPYLFSGLSVVDALFESMSGLTTTGATILADFDHTRSLFLWRAMTQWIGGLGVIALSVVVLPRLGIAGRQLFFAEASTAPADAVSPQVQNAARLLWVLYMVLTLLCAVALLLSGMDLFDAICNALTTLAAGGFSPHGESILGYHNPRAEWVLTLFMLLAGTSFPLQLKVYMGKPLGFFRDGEFRMYFLVAAGAVAVLYPMLLDGGMNKGDALRAAAFQVTSLISSTGFASIDYNLWSDSARAVLVFVMIMGGCAGSAAGGPKIVRYLLVLRHILREITQVLHPRAVLALTYNGKLVTDPVMRAVIALVLLYLGGYVFLGVTLTIIETDFVTAFSAAVACLGNIGPGFETVGPEGNFASFSTAAKLLLVGAMWVGRLEIIAVLALLHPDVRRSLRMR